MAFGEHGSLETDTPLQLTRRVMRRQDQPALIRLSDQQLGCVSAR
jgi:hypothetical protein